MQVPNPSLANDPKYWQGTAGPDRASVMLSSIRQTTKPETRHWSFFRCCDLHLAVVVVVACSNRLIVHFTVCWLRLFVVVIDYCFGEFL
jgi:hypothetical protein